MKWSFIILLNFLSLTCISQSPAASQESAAIKQQKVLFDKFFELSAGDPEEFSTKTTLAIEIMKIEVPSRYYRYARIWSEMLINLKELNDTTVAKAESFVNNNPDFAEAWFLHGEILNYMNNVECVEKVQRCIEMNPNLGIPYYFLANFYSAQNNPKQSIVYYNLLEKVKPDHKSLYYNRAYEKGKLTDYDGAIADYGKVKPGTDNYPKALFNRGRVYMAKEDYVKAEADFDNFLQIMPDYAAGYYYRGYSRYFTKGKAASCADIQIAKNKGYADAQDFLDKYCQ
jgi:tetratricopeptide (TPR) repeat protein